jgi:IPT/TIG domain/NHL repeat
MTKSIFNLLLIIFSTVLSGCNSSLFNHKISSPQLTSYFPEAGLQQGGETLEIQGSNLLNVQEILVGEVSCPIITLQDSVARCQTQAGSIGWHPITFKLIDNTTLVTGSKFARGALVLGQPDFYSNVIDSTTTGFSYTRGLATDGMNLLAGDTDKKRIFLWNLSPLTMATMPNAILEGYFNTPEGICTDGTRVFVSDYSDNKVLVWNSFPTASKQLPDFILGQPTMTSNLPNQGTTPSAGTLNSPTSLWCDSTHLIVADSSNNRILIWNHPISQNGQNADAVLGQADFLSVAANRGSTAGLNTVNSPRGVHFDGTYFWVADRGNNRILGFNGFPTTGDSAFRVLGQTTVSATSGATTTARLRNPYSVTSDGSYLYVADTGNHRVVGWNLAAASGPLSWAHGRAFDLLLGQPNATTSTASTGGVTGSSFNTPLQVVKLGSQLMVTDVQNSRILVWATPISTLSAATSVLGQSDLTQASYRSGIYSQRSMTGPSSMVSYPGGFSVLTYRASRLNNFSPLPSVNNALVDSLHGQMNFTTGMKNYDGSTVVNSYSTFNATDVSHNSSSGLTCITETNHRVLCWNAIPAVSNAPADFILGQTTTSGAGTGTGASNLNNANSSCLVGSKIFVADSKNNRILGWNSIPSSNGSPADFVLGQSNFGAGFVASNRGGAPGPETLSYPNFISCDGGKLIVSDSGNNRILIWNTLPTSSGVPADLVIGQPDFASIASGNSLNSFSSPRGILLKNNRLYVADEGNHRLLIWNSLPTSNGVGASLIFGQQGPGLSASNQGLSTLKLDTLFEPRSIVSFDDDRIAIGDKNNNRVLILPNF